jgi:hypothetical protein
VRGSAVVVRVLGMLVLVVRHKVPVRIVVVLLKASYISSVRPLTLVA